MISCPACNQPLSETDFQRGNCPKCGIALERGSVVEPGSSDSSRTPESSSFQRTIDADVVDLSQLQEAGIGRTIDMGPEPLDEIGQTIAEIPFEEAEEAVRQALPGRAM